MTEYQKVSNEFYRLLAKNTATTSKEVKDNLRIKYPNESWTQQLVSWVLQQEEKNNPVISFKDGGDFRIYTTDVNTLSSTINSDNNSDFNSTEATDYLEQLFNELGFKVKFVDVNTNNNTSKYKPSNEVNKTSNEVNKTSNDVTTTFMDCKITGTPEQIENMLLEVSSEYHYSVGKNQVMKIEDMHVKHLRNLLQKKLRS